MFKQSSKTSFINKLKKLLPTLNRKKAPCPPPPYPLPEICLIQTHMVFHLKINMSDVASAGYKRTEIHYISVRFGLLQLYFSTTQEGSSTSTSIVIFFYVVPEVGIFSKRAYNIQYLSIYIKQVSKDRILRCTSNHAGCYETI